DPPGWVTARDYASRDPGESLARFLAERERSLQWLDGLEVGATELDRPKLRPSGEAFTARELIGAWAAHDLLHVRQITKLRYDFLAREVAPLTLEYAGKW